MEKMEIRKGGKLINTRWVYDNEKEEGEYKEFDITSQAIRKLFEVCELEEGVTLRDIFLLLDSEIELFDAVLGNWCKELVSEGLDNTPKPYDLSTYDPEQIEYLELRLTPEYSKNKEEGNCLYGMNRPDFGGVGVELQNDGDQEHFKKGERVPWGVCMTPVNELINIPVKLSDKLEIHHSILNPEVKKAKPYPPAIASFDNPQFTLGQILEGIVWELSFHGGPESRDKFSEELKQTVEDIKSGTVKTVPMDEAMERLKKED